MSLNGAAILTAFSRFIADSWASTTTSAGNAGGTTLVDTALQRRGDDGWRDYYVRLTSGTATLEIRRVTDFTNSTSTLTVAPAFSAQVASAVTYELHRYDPAEKFTALDEARIRAYPDLGILRFNDTLTGDGFSTAFDIPSAIRTGPLFAIEETPLAVQPDWNCLLNPVGDSLTGWSAASATSALFNQSSRDRLIPKYDGTCQRVEVATATNGTVTQVVGSMINGMTAAIAAGRQVTFAAWVFCRVASRVALQVIDDGTTNTGTAHGGNGWELLTVTADISRTNATTLSVRFNVTNATGAVVYWWNRAWFYLGDANRVQNVYARDKSKRLRRDDTTQKLYFDFAPLRGYQIRLIGRDTLSALGTTAATQITNTMEVDEESAQVLYGEAARVLFTREGINTSEFPEVSRRLQIADRLRVEMGRKWKMQMPEGKALVGMWAS